MIDATRVSRLRLDHARGIDQPRVSVVIPTLNEARNLPWVLERLPVTVHEVVLVDGNSTDDTVAVARAGHANVRVVAQHARGKGAAIAAGLLAARGDIIVMIDADGSMDPAEIPALVGALLAGADVAKGSRRVVGGGSDDLTRVRAAGNWLLTVVGRALYRQRWSELCYGYAAFWADAIPRLGLGEIAGTSVREMTVEEEFEQLLAQRVPREQQRSAYGHGFEIEAILFTRSARRGLRITEVASWEYNRKYGASKLSTFRDGWRVLTALFRERLGRTPSPAVQVPTQTDASPQPMVITLPSDDHELERRA